MMNKDNNKLYKDIVLEVSIDAKKGAKKQSQETKVTFYSYDIDSGLVKINLEKDDKPLPLANGAEVLVNVVKLGLPQQKLVFTGDIVDAAKGTVYWEIPEQLRGYKGTIRAGVFINLPNGQRLHGGYFKFNMGISEIDTNLEEFKEDYWQDWHNFQTEAEAEWSDWKASRDDTWDKHEKDFSDWKENQEEKQTNFENGFSDWTTQQEKEQKSFEDERAQHWENFKTKQKDKQNEIEKGLNSWEYTQENKQEQFENDFKNWQSVQEEKQDNFESSANQKHKQIDSDIDSIEQRVEETNDELENLDVYSKQETDNKLKNKASKEHVDNQIQGLFEHDFIDVANSFDNGFPEDDASKLQYIVQGNIMIIFGMIKNNVNITGTATTIIGKIPDKFKLLTEGYNVGTYAQKWRFMTRINRSDHEDFPNTVTIRGIVDGNGEYVDINSSANSTFYIHLVFGIKENN